MQSEVNNVSFSFQQLTQFHYSKAIILEQQKFLILQCQRALLAN